MHKIRHLSLEVITGNRALANGWEEDLCMLGNNRFWEPLEAVFDRFTNPETIVQIDSLSLTLQVSADGEWTHLLQKKIQEQLEEFLVSQLQLSAGAVIVQDGLQRHAAAAGSAAHSVSAAGRQAQKAMNKEEIRILASSRQEMEIFFYYLLHGTLPWAADPQKFTAAYLEKEFREVLLQYPALWKHFVEQNQQYAGRISQRLTYQCPDDLVITALQLLAPDTAGAIWAAGRWWALQLQSAAGLPQPALPPEKHFRQLAVAAVLRSWPALPATGDLLAACSRNWLQDMLAGLPGDVKQLPEKTARSLQAFQKIISANSELHAKIFRQIINDRYPGLFSAMPDTGRTDEPLLADKTTNASADILDEPAVPADGYEVAHAGMVLLYPYIQPFFMHLQLLDRNNCFRDDTARQQGVYWWHYLAGGKTELPEHVCLLGKTLCGVPAGDVLLYRPAWHKDDLAEASNVLQAFIGHWAALKNCSVDALRETFLMRRGNLLQAEGNWILQVENTAVDILLERLPFPLSHIYLPWLHTPLLVKWLN